MRCIFICLILLLLPISTVFPVTNTSEPINTEKAIESANISKDSLEVQINSLKQQITELLNTIVSLQNQVSQLKSRIESLEKANVQEVSSNNIEPINIIVPEDNRNANKQINADEVMKNISNNINNKLTDKIPESSKAKRNIPKKDTKKESQKNIDIKSKKNDDRFIKKEEPINRTDNETVYKTATGGKYHSAGCRYLKKSAIPISKSDAQKQGLTPCSVCNP